MYADFSSRPESSYRVHVGVPPIRSTVLFPELLQKFHDAFSIPVVLHEYSSRRSLEQLEKGNLDCCLVNVEEPLLAMYDHAILMQDSFVFLVSGNSPLCGRKYITAKDLAGYPLILQNSDSALNTQITRAFDRAGITPDVQMYSSQMMTILDFVSRNQGGAFLYSSMISEDGHIGSQLLRKDLTICSIPFRPEIRNTFAIVWAKGGYINRNVRAWISFVKENLTW